MKNNDLVENIAVLLHRRMVDDYNCTEHRAEDFADWVRGFKKETESEVVDQPRIEQRLKGYVVCFSGTFDHMTRVEAKDYAESLGAKVSRSVSGKTDILARGPGAGSKAEKALSLDILIIDEDTFIGILNGNLKVVEDDEYGTLSTAPKGERRTILKGWPVSTSPTKQPETIVAAAISIEGVTLSLPLPARHGQVLHAADAAGLPDHMIQTCCQGFLTSTGRFVNRVQAKQIAHMAEQPQMRPESERHDRDLFSEDLW